MVAKQRVPYEDTQVPVYRTRGEIDELLRTAGATGIAWMEGDHPDYPTSRLVALRFIRKVPTGATGGAAPITVRVLVPVPQVRDRKEQDQLLRAYHRSLFYYLKAQIDAVNRGLVEFTEAFLPHLELPNGQTVYQAIGPQYLEGAVRGDIRPLALLPTNTDHYRRGGLSDG